MCGRYAASKDVDGLVEVFEVVDVVDPPPPANYNVAPTDPVPVVLTRPVEGEPGPRQLRTARWGLVPSWAKDVSVGARMINARWESLESKPAFRKAFATRRCLLPADGYYEWQRIPGAPKQPFFIHRADGAPLAMAGLFEFWRPDRDSEWLLSASVITMPAAGPLSDLHDRMPAMVPAALWEEWLDPASRYAGPPPVLPADLLAAYPVSTAVNKVGNNGPQLLDRV